jgi:hypothetical protein
MNTFLGFVHRINADSTVDSICMKCFQTVTVGKSELDLVRAEQVHSCAPLYERQRYCSDRHQLNE